MKSVTFYDPTTGRILGTFSGPEDGIDANTPTDAGVIEGAFNWREWRIDLETLLPVARDDNAAIDAAEARQRLTAVVLSEIALLESQQARAVREFISGRGAQTAKARLEAIDDQIATLREQLP